jgi:hypothetical protein
MHDVVGKGEELWIQSQRGQKLSESPGRCRNVYIVYGYLSHSDDSISRNKTTDERDKRKNRMTGRIQIRILSQHIFGPC